MHKRSPQLRRLRHVSLNISWKALPSDCATLDPIERRQWIVLLAIVSLLVGWNYWLDNFFFSSPFALFGGGFGDFEIYRLAGAAWLSHANPYVTSPPLLIYPPTSLPFFALYASIPFHFAGQLWWFTYFFVFVVACIWLCLTLKGADRRLLFCTIVALLFFTSYPLLVLFQLGQVDLLVEALAVMGLALQRWKHGFLSAFMLSLSVLLKGPAVLLLVYFVLFRRDLAYLLHFLLSVLVVVGVSLLLVPVADYWYYLIRVVPTFSGVISANSNQSLGGLISMTYLHYLASAVSLGGFVLFTFFSYWAGGRRLPFSQELPSDAMFLMNVLIMLLFGPRAIIYPYVWVILPLALFVSALLMEHVRAGYLALIGLGAFMLNSNLVPSILSYHVLPLELVGNLLTTLGLVILYVRPSATATAPTNAHIPLTVT